MNQSNYSNFNEIKIASRRTYFSILLFIFTYLFTLSFSIFLLLFACYLLFEINLLFPNIFLILISVGILLFFLSVVVFLVLFSFKREKENLEGLVEITEDEEPKLFELINEISKKASTSLPKKVYLAADVNMSVFYPSSLWSLFVPSRKYLIIGMGILNSLTIDELKATLGHEFGHFSQKNKSTSTSIYLINKIIYNFIYGNSKFDEMIKNLAMKEHYMLYFFRLSVYTIEGIKMLMAEIYGLVNKNYLSLSRELEFHADQFGAQITSKESLENSLLKLELCNLSYLTTLQFYEQLLPQNKKSSNLYSDHTSITQFLAKYNSIEIKNELPDVKLQDLKKLTKSKLIFINQWASHPSIEDRVIRLRSISDIKQANNISFQRANVILSNPLERQIQFTEIIFSVAVDTSSYLKISNEEFMRLYQEEIEKNSIPTIYNGYYDFKKFFSFDLEGKHVISIEDVGIEALFSDYQLEISTEYRTLVTDLHTLQLIKNNFIETKSFEYDGIRYKRNQVDNAIKIIEKEKDNIIHLLNRNDEKIYSSIQNIDKDQVLKKYYLNIFRIEKKSEELASVLGVIQNKLQFVSVNTELEVIKRNFKDLKNDEKTLKDIVKEFLEYPYISELKLEVDIKNIEKYVSKEWEYFGLTIYNNEELELLYAALQSCQNISNLVYFDLKNKLLKYQEKLLHSKFSE